MKQTTYHQADQIKQLVDKAQRIVILQADNPDADSLGSALALEQILHELGKEPFLYCGIDMPSYLKYLAGWDRVDNELPIGFDLSIIVDTSTLTLFERLIKAGGQSWVGSKPCIILDHHEEVGNPIPFATVTINDPGVSSTGELIYRLGKQLSWPLNLLAQEFIMTAVLGDTQGLSNSLASASTYRIMADMVDEGVDRPKLEESRREYGKMSQSIFKYKAELINRTEFYADGRLAIVSVPQNEINEFSPLYNPAPLIQGDMLQTENVGVAIVFKQYSDGRITAAIRCNPLFHVGADLAEYFGGGGHLYASGFKVQDGRSFDNIKADCIRTATELMDKLDNK
jgi:phosphoesterase RecJ-like protein